MTNQKFYNSTKKLNSNVSNDILLIVFFFYGSTFESIFGGCKAKRPLELRCLSLHFFPHAFYAIVVVKLKPQQSQIYVVFGSPTAQVCGSKLYVPEIINMFIAFIKAFQCSVYPSVLSQPVSLVVSQCEEHSKCTRSLFRFN